MQRKDSPPQEWIIKLKKKMYLLSGSDSKRFLNKDVQIDTG